MSPVHRYFSLGHNSKENYRRSLESLANPPVHLSLGRFVFWSDSLFLIYGLSSSCFHRLRRILRAIVVRPQVIPHPCCSNGRSSRGSSLHSSYWGSSPLWQIDRQSGAVDVAHLKFTYACVTLSCLVTKFEGNKAKAT